ncbi:hypothetical protein BASA50_005750 [Batrachochytrium salamandrivorans]|uniref:LEM-like domain-containing protein n=1 Tax=Batrachochytrium salamandrivorans TaxID=1357716 RepID=A0ABQ8FBW2_9FUNG|nr:hypothetical protein BASA50_005750 [Batrachochytrium salamandrivorans]
MSASRHLHDEDGSSSMKDTAKGSTQGSVPDYLLPGFEPSRATISQLCSALAAHNIPLPGSRQLKSVYVDLFERNLTIETRRAWVEQMQLVQPCAEGIVQVGSDGRSETLLHADSTPPRPSSISSPATPTAHAATVSAKTNLLRLLPIAGGQAKTLPKKRPASSDTTHGSSSSSNGNGSSIGNNTSGSIATKATPLLPRRVSFSSNKENAVDQVSDSPSARDRLASTMHSASALLRKISVPRRRPQNASTTTTTTTTISSTSMEQCPGGDTLTTTLTTEIPTTHGWSESMLGADAESESGTTEHNKMEAAAASDVASTTTTAAPSLFYHHNSIYDSLDDSISSTLHGDDHKEDVLHKRTRTCPDQTDRPPPSLASPARNITPTKIHVFGRSSPSCLSSSSSINLHSNSSVSSIDLASNDKLATNNDSSNINYNYHYSTTTTTATTAAPRYRNSPASKSPKSIYRRATSPTKTSTAATTSSQDNGTAPYRSKFYIDPYMPGVRSRVGGSAVHTNQTPLIHADSLFPDSVMLDSETNEDHHAPPKSPFAISAERVSARSVYPDPITSGQSDSLRTPKEAAKEIDDDSTVAEPDEGMSLYSDEVVETWESEKDGETKGSDSLYSKAASVSASTGTWWSFLLLFTCVMMVVVSIVAAGVYWQELNELVQMPFNEHHPAHALYVKMAHMYDHHSQIVVDHTLQVMGVIRDYTMDIALAIYALIGKYYAMGCRTAEDSAAVVIAYFQETTAALPIYTEKISAAATSLYAHASEVVAQSPWLVSLGVNLRVMATLIVREHLKLMHEVLAWGLALWSSLDLSTMHAILAEGARMTDIAVKQIADVSALVLDPVMEMVHSVLKG